MDNKILKLFWSLLLITFFLSAVSHAQAKSAKNLILYTSVTDGFWQVWRIDVDAEKAEQLTFSKSDKRYPRWVNNNKIAYRDANSSMIVLDLENNKESRFLKDFDAVLDPRFSRSGKQIAFARMRSDLMDDSDIWVVGKDGKGARLINSDLGLQYNPVWSPDEKRIAYVSGKGYGTHEIWTMDTEGKERIQLTDNERYDILPDFSPDGEKIAYASDMSGNYDIWVMDKDGGNKKRLTDYEGLDTSPSWSEDGKKIAFTSIRSGSLQIWIMDKDGKNLKQLTSEAECRDPDWLW